MLSPDDVLEVLKDDADHRVRLAACRCLRTLRALEGALKDENLKSAALKKIASIDNLPASTLDDCLRRLRLLHDDKESLEEARALYRLLFVETKQQSLLGLISRDHRHTLQAALEKKNEPAPLWAQCILERSQKSLKASQALLLRRHFASDDAAHTAAQRAYLSRQLLDLPTKKAILDALHHSSHFTYIDTSNILGN